MKSLHHKCEDVKLKIYHVCIRDMEDILWCSVCADQKPLYWYDGKLVCLELRENMDKQVIHVANICIGECKTYSQIMKIDGVKNIPVTYVPVIKACGLYESIIQKALECVSRETDMKGKTEKKHG